MLLAARLVLHGVFAGGLGDEHGLAEDERCAFGQVIEERGHLQVWGKEGCDEGTAFEGFVRGKPLDELLPFVTRFVAQAAEVLGAQP